MFDPYDIIVVGGGHAGCEAAAAAARLGSRVLLCSANLNTVGQMSCNPAMGGMAKGQMIREIDALGGMSAQVTDRSTIQFRMLNRSKGPAVWSPRAQCDRHLFARNWRSSLEQIPGVDLWQDMVVALVVRDGKTAGVKTSMGMEIAARSVVLTNGTFLNGIIHIGKNKIGGGRLGEKASQGIAAQLSDLGFDSGRLKTGTPPRVDGRSLDFSQMEVQHGDPGGGQFSFGPDITKTLEQKPCHITYTNPQVHDALEKGIKDSAMFQEAIEGTPPRYCPSIEDKIRRFADKDRHQIFVEPEGLDTCEIYVNGFSTSLPLEVQYEGLKRMDGFNSVKILRPGYAVEYDYFDPTQLHLTLETKIIENLFFAGQINGTTGYEEAAAQGLMAGINAHQKIHGKEAFTLKRSEAYIGVLLDDLVNKGTDEPYRMFTSRAEFRLLLRQDNADLRLVPKGHAIGLCSQKRCEEADQKMANIAALIAQLKKCRFSRETIETHFPGSGGKEVQSGEALLRRPEFGIAQISQLLDLGNYEPSVLQQAEIQIKYEHYIQRASAQVKKLEMMENSRLKPNLDYMQISSISTEAREKLSRIKPSSLGQASRISGVSASDIGILMVHLAKTSATP